MTDNEYMALAITEADKAQAKGGLPFGALVVSGDEIIGRGHSREHELQDVTAHAETAAVSEASRHLGIDLSGCTLYASGEPCNMCAAAAFQARIGRVVIGASRSDLPHIFRVRDIGIDDLAADSGYGIEIVRGVLRDEAAALFNGIRRL
jgi:tRNA(adenine34) deaminase